MNSPAALELRLNGRPGEPAPSTSAAGPGWRARRLPCYGCNNFYENKHAHGSSFLTTASLLTARADAASAIAIDPYGHLTRAYDPFDSVEEARAHALDLAFKHGWMSARIVASTSRYGECAIAIAYTRDGEVIGVSLGQCTEAEADVRAIASCIRQGGFYPRVYCRFKG
jgi:hypothetical protein